MKLNRETLKTGLKIGFLMSVTILAGWIIADDDDDEDEEHEHRHRRSYVDRQGYREFAPIPQNAASSQWKSECAGCHMLYHPGLLPERSWNKMMAGLDKHFGENASLEPKVRDEIKTFLASNAADHASARRSAKINQSIPTGEVPLRISETTYFKRKHHEIRASVYQRKKISSPANCVACHQDAEKGDFSEERVKIPR